VAEDAVSEESERLRARAEKELEAADPARRREELVAEFKAFVRAGGAISWDRWRTLDAASRAAFAEAGEDVAQHRAYLVARFVVELQKKPGQPSRDRTPEDILDEAIARAAARSAGEVT
jgi:hypothetical protein